MKIHKFIWYMIITFMIINSNLHCQYDKNINTIIYNNSNRETTYSMINYDSVKIAVKKYDTTNQKRFKDIFIKNHLKEFENEIWDFPEVISANLDSLSIKTIPRFQLCIDDSNSKYIQSFEINTAISPERIFVMYKDILLGFFSFNRELDYPHNSIFKQVVHAETKYENFYNCLCNNEINVYICGIGITFALSKNSIIASFDECLLDTKDKVFLNEESLIEAMLGPLGNKKRNCECDMKSEYDTYDFWGSPKKPWWNFWD